MAKKLLAIPMALAAVLGAQTATLAQASSEAPMITPDHAATINTMTRGEMAIKPGGGTMIADLPGGHWATNATQVAVANNILPLQDGKFMGDRPATADDLAHAMDSLANTAETIANKGSLTDLRSAIASLPHGNQPVSRLELTQSLSHFLDAAANDQLIALAAPKAQSTRFTDLGASVPPSVTRVVDKYKVLTGYPDLTFRPKNHVTRYQLAATALNVLNAMRQAPLAMQPIPPQVAQAPTVIVVPPEQPQVAEVPMVPQGRPNFRQRVPVHLGWQALNATNLNGSGSGAFNVIPVEGMITGYTGPLMLQNVTNFRYDVFQSNLLDSEFRVGYSGLKYGMAQFIPYVGANVGVGASVPNNNTQYDTYVGATYGGILSIMPMDNLEIFGQLGQAALLAGGRFNQNFNAVAYPNALGSFLSSYGVGADFYVAPNIALSLGVNTWQTPTDLRVGNSFANSGVVNTYGGNVGVGFSF